MRYVYFLIILFCSITLNAQQMSIKKGVVTNNVNISDSISESFSVYLPKDYNTSKRWPVIYVFDPSGAGENATKLFSQAGEEQGYIIVASNNINTGDSLVNSIRIATRLIAKTQDYFSINPQLMYSAGIAYGAKVAGAIPLVYKDLKGIISVSDFWISPEYNLNAQNPHFLAMAGNEDYSVYKLNEVVRALNGRKPNAQYVEFQGGGEWPSLPELHAAIGNFTLMAMNSNLRPKEDDIVELIYNQDLQNAESLVNRNKFYDATLYLENIKRKYARYNKENDLDTRISSIESNSDFKSQRRAFRAMQQQEQIMREDLFYYLNEDLISANFENLGWWNQQINDLDALAASNNRYNSIMGKRLKGYLADLLNESFAQLQQQNAHIDTLIYTAVLKTIVDKYNPDGYFSIISLTAQDGDYETALLYLEDLLKTGYNDEDRIYSIPGTLGLRLSPEFNEVVKKYLNTSRYYNTPS